MTPDRQHAALLVVDIQPDFLPGGSLPVGGGDEILPSVAQLMRSERYGVCVATQDWHPAGHVSFAARHGRKPMETIQLYGHAQTLWPDHCVQGTPGAALHAALPFDRADAIIRKGTDPAVDSYSGFRNNWNAEGQRPPTGLAGYLMERGVEQVFICGLARDVCVKWTAEDAADAGFRTFLIWDLSRAVDPSSDAAVRVSFQERGVQIVLAADLHGT
jgi:nicotinamidase/pyrazinamidase